MHRPSIVQVAIVAFASLSVALPGPTQDVSINPTKAVLSSFPLLERQAVNNTCGIKPGQKCNPNSPGGGPCCSNFGYCGNGPLYCEKGCQSQFGDCKSKHNRQKHCGPRHKNKSCGGGDCCSKNGVCGVGEAFCGKHCQPKFGHCPVPLEPQEEQQPMLQSVDDQNKKELRCGKDFDNKSCPFPKCCSAAGYCGKGPEYCGVPGSCQPRYGTCDSTAVPLGLNTSSEVRNHDSKVPYGKLINKCTKPRFAALTFDDGPHEQTEKILDLLHEYKAKATFFLTADNNGKGEIDTTPRWTKVIKRMIMEGHQIGAHTWDHPHMNNISSEARKNEMYKTERAIANIVGRFPAYMRPPYLQCDDKSGCLKDMSDLGYHVIGYEIDSGDWKSDQTLSMSKEQIDAAFNTKSENDNILIIQHDHASSSVELTKYILDKVHEKGWTAGTVGSCLDDPVPTWHRVPRGTSIDRIPKDGCVVAGPGFCGTINPFNDANSCFYSRDLCLGHARGCLAQYGRSKTECTEFEHICSILRHHCEECVKKGCQSQAWKFDRNAKPKF